MVARLKESKGFPPTLSAAEVGKLPYADAQAHAKTMAETLHSNGFNLDFAPVADVNVNPLNPVIGKLGRSFSSNPERVIIYNEIFANELQYQHIQCVLKHFPGHGSSDKDSHLGFVDVTNTWQRYELLPFKHEEGARPQCGMIMSAHIVNRLLDPSGLPATLSHKMLTTLLREKLNFKGVILSDDMQMKAISDNFSQEQALVLAINAGVDMFIFNLKQTGNNSQSVTQLIDRIEKKVLLGQISIERIHAAYQHIETLKQTL